ncbi:phosphoribosylanthranilate isomerase [Niallia sp. Sow4_A1]|uniref:N-(5'-phosphoribosyl)anthranilate isomerase n=1 Tax=Niallia hominis TaxID=3133173 RepID=A0ABV1F729_9BACI|nr:MULTISPECIES: phosphoribosylanthranilate isomerase [Bacillaceae]MCF2649629.1 phosphoribosylanthranilate isomerase [Niallia circulans]MCM3362901.1 phosphoribosylanthranilate isomerase [Niallia sp. MER TA 168]CAI9386718.1 N-(5'-phosphoribosyl)anthranilate isomerase [Bacillus sp. T2.9-1]
MKVKICGITTKDAAACAVQYGADALGFVFANSKRKINPEKAKEIIDTLPKDIMKVGVFVNETKENIEKIVKLSGINTIQLHGDETPEFASSFSLPIIKAFSISSKEDLQQVTAFPCEYALLDSPRGKYHGGNGIAFDWSIIKNYDFGQKQIILAGGLNISNLAEAIQITNPFMVDVSSGVETDGKKDLVKIKNFLQIGKTVHI